MPFNKDQLAQLASFGRNLNAPDGKTLDDLHAERIEAAGKLRAQIAELEEKLSDVRSAAYEAGRQAFAQVRAEHLRLVERCGNKHWVVKQLQREFEDVAPSIMELRRNDKLVELGFYQKSAKLSHLREELVRLERQIELDHKLGG